MDTARIPAPHTYSGPTHCDRCATRYAAHRATQLLDEAAAIAMGHENLLAAAAPYTPIRRGRHRAPSRLARLGLAARKSAAAVAAAAIIRA